MIPPLVISLNLPMDGAGPTMRLACNIMLGLELNHLKATHGYSGSGLRPAYLGGTNSGERLSWEAFCKAQAGISDDSAKNFLECAEALKHRVRWSDGLKGRKRLLKQLEQAPSMLPAEERMALIELSSRLLRGCTQTLLRKEFRAAQPMPDDAEQRDGYSDDLAERMEQRKAVRLMHVLADHYRKHDTEVRARLALNAFISRRNGDNRF